MLVDSHCHLDHLDTGHYSDGLAGLLASARNRGVTAFLSVGVDLLSSQNLQKLADQYNDVWISVGVHPLQKQRPPLPEIDELIALGSHPKVVAIGETGLDFHYDEKSADWQRESFKRHLQAAAELNKPTIVHTRNARAETLDILKAYSGSRAGVLHCFTESWEMARAALDMGYYISFSGIVTFRNANELRDVVKRAPLDRILVETDSPWLAPVPHRGGQNEPKYVCEVAQCVADLKGVSLNELAQETTANFQRLFACAVSRAAEI